MNVKTCQYQSVHVWIIFSGSLKLFKFPALFAVWLINSSQRVKFLIIRRHVYSQRFMKNTHVDV